MNMPQKPEPPEVVRGIDGFAPWNPKQGSEMVYGFRCGVLWGVLLAMVASGIAMMLLMVFVFNVGGQP